LTAHRQGVFRALTALAVAGVLAGCTAPVRLATPSEVKQANAPRPSAASSPAAPNQGIGSGTAPAPSPAAGAGSSPAPATAGSGSLAQMQNELRQLIDQVTPSVVQIDTSNGLGSGIVLDTQGDIVTNAHVIATGGSFTITASDGRTFPGTLVGSYSDNDLAVVKANGATGLKPAAFGDSSQVHVGDIVVTVGSPLGLTGSASEGIISGTGRSESEGNGVTLTNLLQTTAPISPGDSGGALVDIGGRVIGIPTLGASSSPRGGSASNIGFAIPSNQAVNVTKQLISGGAVTSSKLPYLGITTSSSGSGALVASVVGGGPADKAGVQAGWTITALGGHPVADSSAISQILSGLKPGDRVDLRAQLPDGSQRTVNITVGERPANP
jgi:putative serine protease PepD